MMRHLLLAMAVLTPGAGHASDYVRIDQSVMIDRGADAVWQRIGSYCAIAEWMQVSCDYASGAGEAGTVRRLRDATIVEVMVAKTAHSYTYWQTAGTMAATGYHGTLAVEPLGARRSRLSYTLVYDQAALASDALRASEHERIAKRFLGLLGTMKELVMKR